eukprot:ANDGO_01831.mRNA.1 hypothetical protein
MKRAPSRPATSGALVKRLLIALGCVLLCASGTVNAQEPMCGQKVWPEQARIHDTLDSLTVSFTPLVAVTNPIFRISVPNGNFFEPYTPQRGLHMEVSGCINGVDTLATANRDLGYAQSRAGQFSGTIQLDKPCNVTLKKLQPTEFPLDLRLPRLTYGSVLNPQGNWYDTFAITVMNSNAQPVMQSYNGNGKHALMRVLNHVQNVTVSGIRGTVVSEGSGSFDALQFKFYLPIRDPHMDYNVIEPPFNDLDESHQARKPGDPGYDPTHGEGDLPSYPDSVNPFHYKVLPSQNRFDFEFNTDVYTAGSTYGISVTGCVESPAGKVFHATSARFGYGKVGDTLIGQGWCTVTVSKIAGSGQLVLPSATDIQVNVYIMHDHGVSRWDHTHDSNPAVPLYVGMYHPVTPSQWKDFSASFTPNNVVPRGPVQSITISGRPRNFPAAASVLQVQLTGITFVGIANGQTQNDWRMDVSGCGATLQNIRANSVCTEGKCTIWLPANSAFILTDATCTVQVQPQSTTLAATFYAGSGQVQVVLASTTDATQTSIQADAINYAMFSVPIHTLRGFSTVVDPSVAGQPLKSLVLKGTPFNTILSTENPQISITLPRGLGAFVGSALQFQVSGCTTYGPASHAVPAVTNTYIPCDFDILLPLASPINGGVECVVTITAPSSSTFRVPNDAYYALTASFSTLKNGNILDEPAAEDTLVTASAAPPADTDPQPSQPQDVPGANSGSPMHMISVASAMVFATIFLAN